MTRTHTIYLVTQVSTGKRYVGMTIKGIERRWMVHVSKSRRGSEPENLLGREMRRVGADDFTITCLRTTLCPEKASLLEQNYIRDLGTLEPGGFNTQSGGHSGYRASDRQRELLRCVHLGIKRSPESIEKGAAKLRGRKRDPEMIARSAAKRRGAKRTAQFANDCRERARNMSAETRAKISATSKANWINPAYRERMVISALKAQQDPIVRARAVAALELGRAVRYGRASLIPRVRAQE